MKIKISSERKSISSGSILLAADVGGTKTNMYLFTTTDDGIEAIKDYVFHTEDYKSMEAMVEDFLTNTPKPDRICFGVAGPVTNGRVELTNVGWPIVAHSISVNNDNVPVVLLNDLEATAYSIEVLDASDMHRLKATGSGLPGNIGVIAPGTGLGEAGMFWDGKEHHPFATEGGHCDFAQRTPQDVALFEYLKGRFGRVSWERLLSGHGIDNIFDYLCSVEKMDVPQQLANDIARADNAAAISAGADKYDIAKRTIDLFFDYLAQESANMALKFKATAGIFIGGGIVPKNLQYFDEDKFVRTFCKVGRMADLLREIPVTVILNDKAALIGAACYGACKM